MSIIMRLLNDEQAFSVIGSLQWRVGRNFHASSQGSKDIHH